jgi:hypothetical protein
VETSFDADSACGSCFRFLVDFRVTLVTDSITSVVSMALRIACGNANDTMMSPHFSRPRLTIVG